MNLPKTPNITHVWSLFNSHDQQIVDHNTPLISFRFALMARIATVVISMLVMLTGILVVTAQLLTLPQIFDSFGLSLNINFYAGWGLIICALSLVFLRNPEGTNFDRITGKAFAALAVLIGLITIIEYLAGLKFVFDRWLIDQLSDLTTTLDLGISLFQTILLTLLGLALLMLDRGEVAGAEVTQWLVLFTVILLVPSLIGHIYDINVIDAPINYLPFSLVLSYSLLCIGIILSRPLYGMMRIISSYGTGGYLARRLLLAAIIIPVGFGWLVLTGYRMGFYGAEIRLILHIAISGIVFAILIWRSVFALYRIDQERRRATNAIQFLSDTSKAMSVSMNYQNNLQLVARLASQSIAEWCAIEMIDQKSKLIAFNHNNLKKNTWFKQYIKNKNSFSFNFSNLSNTFNTGKSELWLYQNPDQITKLVQYPELYQTLIKLGFDSAILVPIKVKRKVIGIICLANSGDLGAYSKTDLPLADELANRISLAIDNVWLYQSVQRAVKTREEFMSIASHELKTPITTIQVLADLTKEIAKKNKQDNYYQYTEKMTRQIHRLTDLVDDLLDVSRIQSGKLKFQIERFDVNELVSEIVSTMQSTSKQHQIILNGSVRKKILADRERISQVLINLISNAIKYSPLANKVEIHIEGTERQLQISVQDFGIGISSRDQKRIFERFYRVKDLGVRTFPGLGIGLYISAEIIRRHKGKIWVESKEGNGSTFYFTLPWN